VSWELINQGRVGLWCTMSVWQVGAREVLWLVGRGGGEGPGGPGGVFLEKDQREREGGCCNNF
jgi:hypothetical protein